MLVQKHWAGVGASERDELGYPNVALSEGAGRNAADPTRLAAVAFIEADRTLRETQDGDQASSAFLALVDKGSIGPKAAMAGTPYA
ncbi:hypothetical protein ACYG9R_05025 [Mesorhizobium sp. RSR565B]|uniref:hypothetical protein n=1 Tax=Mesorhizobium sp. M0676 TaxID=2956984 RepID=UPI0033378CF3